MQLVATSPMIAARSLDPVLAPVLLLIFAGALAKIREAPMGPPRAGETTRGVGDVVRRGRRDAIL